MTVRVRVLVAGRVQGVFFRASAAEQARRAGVAGFVRNLGDGRVEAVFEGDGRAVEDMVRWCRRGPEFAAVSSVDTVSEEPQDESGFRIL